ncbi:MAG: LysR substrate-binding domain-containing protein [Erythrobacter sp.]
MRRLPPLAAIRAFEAAARHLNYTRAGEELGLTQAGVSYQIRNLEERVGTPLFVRNGRAMKLTPAGEALAPRIAQAFAGMEAAFASLGEDDGAVLSIACFQSFATTILAPRLGSFQVAHPNIAVRLVISDRFVDLDSGECDCAIRLSLDVPRGAEALELAPLEIAPFASPDLIGSHPELDADDPDIPDDLRLSSGNIWWEAWDAARCVERGDKGTGRRPPRGLEFGSQVLDSAAATSGNGIALIAALLFSGEIRAGKLVRVGARTVRPGGSFRLLYPEVRRHSPKVKAFRDWIRSELAPPAQHAPRA